MRLYFNLVSFKSSSNMILILQLTEEKRQNEWSSKFNTPPLSVDSSITIPVMFIDPVVEIFSDPCKPYYVGASIQEKEKFQEWTSKFEYLFDEYPPFDCAERCQAPNPFYSGIPWLSNPENGKLTLSETSYGLLEWQIWQDGLKNGKQSF